MKGHILKKIGSLALSLMLTTSAGAAAVMSAAAMPLASFSDTTEVYGDYKYAIFDDETIKISKYNGSETSVNIPSTIDGKPVTSIGEKAFFNCFTLTSVTIPDSVTSIGSGVVETHHFIITK